MSTLEMLVAAMSVIRRLVKAVEEEAAAALEDGKLTGEEKKALVLAGVAAMVPGISDSAVAQVAVGRAIDLFVAFLNRVKFKAA